MAALTDPAVRARYLYVLSSWQCNGYVVWNRLSREFVEKHIEGGSTKSVAFLMYEYVKNGGEIDRVVERRENHLDFAYHYDLRFEIDGRKMYIETVFHDDEKDPDGCGIDVVNMHYA